MNGNILGATVDMARNNPVELGLEGLQVIGIGTIALGLLKYISKDREQDAKTYKMMAEKLVNATEKAVDHHTTLSQVCDKLDNQAETLKSIRTTLLKSEEGQNEQEK